MRNDGNWPILAACLMSSAGSAASAQTAPVNDPCFSKQHYLHRYGQTSPVNFLSYAGTGAYLAWEELSADALGAPGAGRTVGVIDGGFWFDLDDLRDEEEFIRINLPSSGQSPSSPELHGTAILSLLSAVGDNELDMAGAVYDADFALAVQSDPAQQVAQHTYLVQRFDALDGADADVVSNSWLLDSVSGFADIRARLEEIISVGATESGRGGKGLSFVFAAGNHRLPLGRAAGGVALAAAVPGVIAVANVNPLGLRWFSANYGPWIDIAAPGQDVLTLLIDGAPDPFECGAIQVTPGETSLATPNVAAAVAMILQANSGLEAPQIRRIIQHTARKIDESLGTPALRYSPLRGFNDGLGYGLLDTHGAVAAVISIGSATDPDLSWPASPLSLVVTQELFSDDVDLQWTNATAPAGNYKHGEYDQVLVVRYEGNVWDQQIWPRSPGDDILWQPSHGTPYVVDDQPISGASSYSKRRRHLIRRHEPRSRHRRHICRLHYQ